uniref:Malonyl-CoA-acyl carrier protein transacylase n=1 Tax=Cyprinus carpio TaxID=7962 RepID=A0A8C1JN36_CYPCA
MGKGLLKYGNVKEMVAVAERVLGYDLLSLCLNGLEKDLMKTVHCQPAVFVCSLAAVERLNNENPAAIESCGTEAGVSVGELAALVFSGAMNFAEALFAVKVRAEAMQKTSDLKYAYGRVIAGHKEALDFLQNHSRELNFMRTRLLPVSGIFHTALMEPAVELLGDVLRKIEVRRPEICVHSSVDGKPYMHDKHVCNQLDKQLVSPVKWEQTLHEIYERAQGQEFPHTYEVGPGRQLGSTLQKCNMKAFKNYTHVDVVLHSDQK